MNKLCFIQNVRQCDSGCMAYRGDDKEQACALLQTADGLRHFFVSMAKAAQGVVKHPASPPAPEVR